MVGLNGKVTYGAGHPAHKAGANAEPYAPCVTRKMTPEERAFYGVDSKKGVLKKMGKKAEKKKRGARVNLAQLKDMVASGFTASEIAKGLGIDESVVWERAKAQGLIKKLRAAEETDTEYKQLAGPDPEELSEDSEFIFAKVKPEAAPEYPQEPEENEFRFLSPMWLNELAKGLTKGDKKHPGATWRTIPAAEHVWRAIRHLILFLMGDKNDDHLINAGMRVMMAYETAAGKD